MMIFLKALNVLIAHELTVLPPFRKRSTINNIVSIVHGVTATKFYREPELIIMQQVNVESIHDTTFQSIG